MFDPLFLTFPVAFVCQVTALWLLCRRAPR